MNIRPLTSLATLSMLVNGNVDAAVMAALPRNLFASIAVLHTAPLSPSGATVHYDQTANPVPNGTVIQNFETENDAFDADAADAFLVTHPTGWDVSGFALPWAHTAPVTSFPMNVASHLHDPSGGDGGLPGAAVCQYSDVPTKQSTLLQVDLPRTDLDNKSSAPVRHLTSVRVFVLQRCDTPLRIPIENSPGTSFEGASPKDPFMAPPIGQLMPHCMPGHVL